MRVTMTSVWERTSEVLAGRTGILAGIAAATLWLPVVAMQAIVGATGGPAPATAVAGGIAALLTIAVVPISYWGKLAIVAVAGEPAFTAGDAYRVAARRLGVMIGLLLIVLAVLLVLALPVGVALAPYAASLPSYDMARASIALGALPPGRAAFVSLYLLVVAVVLAWAAVRLLAVGPVVLFERRGIASFRRSFQVTRGHFWRLTGVLLLFVLLLLIATTAARTVTGVFAALILGGDHPASVALVVTLFTAAVAAAGSVVSTVFVTRFYLSREG